MLISQNRELSRDTETAQMAEKIQEEQCKPTRKDHSPTDIRNQNLLHTESIINSHVLLGGQDADKPLVAESSRDEDYKDNEHRKKNLARMKQ